MIHLPHAKGITRRSRPEAAESYFRSSALAVVLRRELIREKALVGAGGGGARCGRARAARMHCAPARLGLVVAFLLVLAIVGGPLLPRSSPSEQLVNSR
jgi:hypothetical protein